MPDNHVLMVAVFRKQYSAVVVNGTVNGKEYGKFYEGEDIQVVADPATGYAFDHWEYSGINLSSEQKGNPVLNLKMPDNDVYFEAVFTGEPIMPHTMTVIRGLCNGKAKYTCFPSTKLIVIANASGGLSFDHWKADGVTLTAEQKTSPVLFLYMPDNDATLEAVYNSTPIDPHTITVINGKANGESTGQYFEGSKIEVRADTSGTQRFKEWKATGITLTETQKKSVEFTMNMPDNDVILEATYDDVSPIAPYLINVNKGTVEGLPAGQYFEGSTLSIEADPGTGMVFDYWTATGITLTDKETTSPSFVLTMPGNNVELTAHFKAAPILPNKLTIVNGTVNGKGDRSYFAGTKLVAKADNKLGKKFDHWEAEGIELTAEQKKSANFTAYMPDNDVTLKAVYVSTINTGDNSNLLLYSIIGLLSCIGLILGVVNTLKRAN